MYPFQNSFFQISFFGSNHDFIFIFWIEFVKFNLYHEMDEMVNAYTYQYGYFVVDFRRNGKWHIVWFGLTHSRHEIDVCNTILKKPN